MDRFPGKHAGRVVDNEDPKALGRIRASVPSVLLDETTGWALPSTAFSGPGSGLYAVPPVGASVWIEWPNGDPSIPPVWSGYWTDGAGVADASPGKVVLITPAGHRIVVDDDATELLVEIAGGASVTLAADAATVAVGGQKIELSPSGVSVNDGALEVT